MKEAVGPKLRDQQAGFRRNRSCADQIASLHIIVEQSLEWNSPLYISFIDYEKAFDSVDRETLWKLLRHYGVPKKIISLIRCTFQDMSCKIAHAGQLSESFEVKTGVRQGCLLSPFLFLLVIDWIMKTTTTGRNNGIQWTLWTQLDDLDFADDLALLSHNHSQMQDKTTLLETTSAGTGLKINRKKTELMKMNTTTNAPITVGGEPIKEVESFVYLGSVVDHQGGTDRDVTARIGKARAQLLSCSKTSGHLEESAWEPNSASSTPMWSQSCFTDVRHGGQHRRGNERSRHSSTPVWGASTKSNGKRRSEMKNCGSERDRNQWPSRYYGGSGAGSDTPSGSQHPAPHAKPWPWTRRGRGREAGLATVGGETLKQSWNSRGPTGPEWQEQPRTECDGGGSLMAYAPLGAMGISK